VAQLFVDVFKRYFVDTISMEEQLSDICEKVHKLKNLGYDLKDASIAMLMMVSLLESYASLRQHLYIKDKNTLTMDFVIKQILLEENAHGGTLYIALIGDGKGKKPIHQFQNSHVDGDAKKKNLKCHYCQKKGYFKSECKKFFKANYLSGNGSNFKKGQTSKDKTEKVATTSHEMLVNLFMAHKGSSDLTD